MPMAERSTTRKVRTGVVISAARDKTVTVEVTDTMRHAKYGKTVRSRTRLHAHDEQNDARTGDTVRLMETRPLSKTKRWRVVEILERAR
jgi:small subunit ribosomal protein S17